MSKKKGDVSWWRKRWVFAHHCAGHILARAENQTIYAYKSVLWHL